MHRLPGFFPRCTSALCKHDGVIWVQPLPLRGFDEECREFITEQYQQRGLNLHAESTPERIVKQPDGKLTLHLSHKSGGSSTLEGLDAVLMATGRAPNSRNLGLQEVLLEMPCILSACAPLWCHLLFRLIGRVEICKTL